MPKFIFISVRPDYAFKIINKQKTIELRKNMPSVETGDYLIIYATMPVKTVIGYAKIKKVFKTHPLKMWNEHSDKLGIDKKAFDKYYSGSKVSIGIEINSVTKLNTGIPLQKIKDVFPSFTPPQTYKYFTNIQALKLYKLVS
jgi:predicted transcriptional regulator